MAQGTTKKAPAKKPPTFDRLKSKKGLVRRIPVYLDSEVLEEFESARAEVELLENPAISIRTSLEAKSKVAERYATAKAALDETTVVMVMRRPIVVTDEGKELKGRPAYEWLLQQHPPTEEDNAEAQKEHQQDAPYHSETFAPALIAACCDEPKLTAEEAAELLEEWTLNEAVTLFSAAMEVCNSSQVGSLGKGFGGMIGS